MRTKPYLYKRFIAYVVDLLVITIVSSILSVLLLNTSNGGVTTNDLLNLTKKMTAGEITQEEFNEQYNEMYYIITKENFDITAVTCILSLVYYVVIAYFLNGATLGKLLMKLRIKRVHGKLNMGNLLLRSLLVNMVLTNIVSLVLISVLSKSSFLSIYPKISSVFTVIMIVSIILMLYRDDGRGVHDFIGGTIIVNVNDELKEENNEEQLIKNATIVNEKKSEGSGI